MWGNTTPGTPIWLLKDSGNIEDLTKTAEKVFKYLSKLGRKKKKSSGGREENIRSKKQWSQAEKLCLHNSEGEVTRENGRWVCSQICPMFIRLPAGQPANYLNADNEEGHASSQAWIYKIFKILLTTFEIMVLGLHSEQTIWSLEKFQGAPQYAAISLNWIELAEYSLNRYGLPKIITFYQNCFGNVMRVQQDMYL